MGLPERQAWAGILSHFEDSDGKEFTMLGQERA
jgi:hypothetical protein